MTNNVEDLIASINMTQVLVAILEEHKSVTVPTFKFLDANTLNKELVVEYNEEGPSFTFSLRENVKQSTDN
jgi:hypothetical protein